jgi:hypothetical protein
MYSSIKENVSNAMQQVTKGEIAIGMEKVALLLRVSVSCVHSFDTLRPSVILWKMSKRQMILCNVNFAQKGS